MKRRSTGFYRRVKKDREHLLLSLSGETLFSQDSLHNLDLDVSGNNIDKDLSSDNSRESNFYENCNREKEYENVFDTSNYNGIHLNNETEASTSSVKTSTKSILNSNLQHWALTNEVTHSALNNLLKILKPHFPDLPLDARSLLKTPRTTATRPVEPGEYFHFGLQEKVKFLLEKTDLVTSECEICVNIDGLPISKSSGSQLYPILISLFPVNESLITCVGLYHGYDKPKDANKFLNDFVMEAAELTVNGIMFKNKLIPFRIKAFICDVPAKAFIRYTKGHTGFSSCTKCIQRGTYIVNSVCFAGINDTERTDEDFLLQRDEHHHTGYSILTNIPNVGIVSSFPVEYMHLICLGVTRKLILNLWINGKPPHKLSAYQIKCISEGLLSQAHNMPLEFCRKPRSLCDIRRWKATEYRQFLLYTGILTLKPVLKKKYYQHFLALHVSIVILINPGLCKTNVEYAHTLLVFFVKTFEFLYGRIYMSHNIHNLIHLSQDVERFGCLDQFSAFPFENFLHILKRMLRKSNQPVQQIVRRLSEIENSQISKKTIQSGKGAYPCKEHLSNLLLDSSFSAQYSQYVFPKFTLKCKHPDNCCGLKNGTVVIIESFATYKGNQIVVIGKKFLEKTNFYSEPCPSSELGICKVWNLNNTRSYWPIEEVVTKYVKLNERDAFVIIPLLHTEINY